MKKLKRAPVGQIRVIGGQWRGRKLPVLNSPNLRPTTNYIRETLFNWLGSSVIDAYCLDCFAGSGLLGLEALSRYAASVTFIEIKRSIAQQLQKNISILKATNATIVNTDTLQFLSQPGCMHDIVFVDPPFQKKILEETLFLLEKNSWLSEEALIYIECPVKTTLSLLPLHWTLYREKVAGQVAYRVYHKYT